ncbi:testis-expressed protein 46 isoform X1 [Mus musculus]|uniref:testis-expressed protein 46 isoform X1 n=1 Tax=Mus musculus TaxID=10090 RepID=UPI0005ABA47F|nr:testis-expressed protein 46 isoform X1 [Mus musculus]|eukprot:XP_011248629.1 PREDICTED: uncharacterized protein C1orf234 homolog isoform X1 [Mus musculus]
MLPPRAALVSVVLDATRDHVDIHDPCSRWRNHVEVRDLLLAVMDQEASAAKEEAETTTAPEVHPKNNVKNKEELEKINACFALQDKVLERLMFSEMKLKALENQVFVIWNKINRRRWSSRQRNFSRRRHRSRRHDSTFSTLSKCTTVTPTECD